MSRRKRRLPKVLGRLTLSAVDRAGVWKMTPPKHQHQFGWCYILFAPGIVVLAGDAGDLTLQHYHAMPNLDEALDWLVKGDVSYLLGKMPNSTQKKVLDRDATASVLALHCREARSIAEKARGELGGDKPTKRALAAHLEDLSDTDVTELCVRLLESDYYGSYEHTDYNRFLIGCIKAWAKAMLKERKPS